MESQKIILGKKSFLTTYILDDNSKIRDGMLIFPGGSYTEIAYDREGAAIAEAFMEKGFNCFVLNYTVIPEYKYQPLVEASLAMAHIKNNCEKYNINKDRVFSIGFSAGGHLCASLGTMWHDEELNKLTGLEYGINKPCGMILCYPVITPEAGYIASHQNLLGKEFKSKKTLKHFSPNNRVSDQTVPAFIIHTAQDESVPVQNALMMAKSLSDEGIMYEMHIYPFGAHGMALANEKTSMGKDYWFDVQYARYIDDVAFWTKRI